MNFFEGYFDTGQQIGSWEARCEYWGALVHYYHTGEIPDIQSAEARIAFTASKASVASSRSRVEAGRAGGRAKAENAASIPTAKQAPGNPVAALKQKSGKTLANPVAKQKQNAKQKPANMNMKMKEKMKGEEDVPSPASKKPSDDEYEAIVQHLVEKTGRNFRPDSKQTRSLINGRFAEGYTLEDFFYVIDVMTAAWGRPPKRGEKDMRPYLRPKTLFAPGNFEDYVTREGGDADVPLGRYEKPEGSAF